jgi:hypothetical protein
MRTYGHVIDELEDAPRLPAGEAIRQARDALAVEHLTLTRGRAQDERVEGQCERRGRVAYCSVTAGGKRPVAVSSFEE